ncbi:MAG TPA: cellulase family glycosylhydrolase [Thermomicrobiales bacterium]
MLLVALLAPYAPPRWEGRAAGPAFVTIQGDQFILNGQRIAIKGANYYQRNAPWAEMWAQWDGPQVEREVALGADLLGINALRILVPYRHGWAENGTGAVNPVYLDRLRQMVQIAGAHNQRVIVTLFDFADEWPAAGTPEEAAQLRYLTTIVTLFRDDDRVLAWDLHNEPDNYGHWRSDGRPDEVIDWLARMAAATRRLDPNHPLTVGLGHEENNWLEARPGLPRIIDLIDFVGYHAYDGSDFVTPIRAIKARTSKPILLEEAGWPTEPWHVDHGFTEEIQLGFYRNLVAALNSEGVAGAVHWLLLDLTQGAELRPLDYAAWMGLIRPDDSLKPAGTVYASWQVPRLPATVASALPLTGPIPPAAPSLYFPETRFDVAGPFKDLWLDGDGRRLYGLPLTEPVFEGDYLVQYFERAAMEWHPEWAGGPGYAELTPAARAHRVVALRHLGRVAVTGRDFPAAAPFASDPRHWYFAETGHSLNEGFLAYWLANGGLARFGYPISEEVVETLADGRAYTVQYFERARFEYHPENVGTPDTVQLGAVGREELLRRGWLPR